MIVFEVVGLPAPQGSKSAFTRGGRAVIVDGTSKVGRQKHLNWRDDVTKVAMTTAQRHGQFIGPVCVTIHFYMPLPASDQHRTLHSTKPDLDKLVRSVFDSLTNSALIKDDAQIVALEATKEYARDGHWVGAKISVNDWSSVESHARAASKLAAKKSKRKARVTLPSLRNPTAL